MSIPRFQIATGASRRVTRTGTGAGAGSDLSPSAPSCAGKITARPWVTSTLMAEVPQLRKFRTTLVASFSLPLAESLAQTDIGPLPCRARPVEVPGLGEFDAMNKRKLDRVLEVKLWMLLPHDRQNLFAVLLPVRLQVGKEVLTEPVARAQIAAHGWPVN
jgi:hypothetical protein